MRDLAAGAVAEAHAPHAAASHNPAGRMRTFLLDAVLPTIRALNGASALSLLPAMHQLMNAVGLGLVDPKVAPYELWMEWDTSNQTSRLMSMGIRCC